jgi:hypothetical protein
MDRRRATPLEWAILITAFVLTWLIAAGIVVVILDAVS